jgi:hypothetical protein
LWWGSKQEAKKRYMEKIWIWPGTTWVLNSALATRIPFRQFFILYFFFASPSLFIFSIDISIALRTTTTTTKDEPRTNERTNGKTPLLILFVSCLPWLTIAFYICPLSFDFRFATTMPTTITMPTTLVTIRTQLYIARKGCF